MVDAQHKLDAVRALQTRCCRWSPRSTARRRHQRAETRLDGTKFTRRRSSSRRSATSSWSPQHGGGDRGRRAAAPDAGAGRGAGRSAKIKDEMLAELDRVQGRQRDTTSQIQASEDQLMRAEEMYKQLEARRSQVAFGEKKLAAVESRLPRSSSCDRARQEHPAIASREQLVNAVKAEVETVHQISARSQADLTTSPSTAARWRR
jgi:hypothetical protein